MPTRGLFFPCHIILLVRFLGTCPDCQLVSYSFGAAISLAFVPLAIRTVRRSCKTRLSPFDQPHVLDDGVVRDTLPLREHESRQRHFLLSRFARRNWFGGNRSSA